MAFQTVKNGTLLAPLPVVMVSCADGRCRPNIITVAWTGVVNSDPPMCSVSVRKERFSHDIIERSGEFVINLCSRDTLRATDFCGVRSGRDVDKFAACELTAEPVEGMAFAPAIAQCPAYIACKVKSVTPLGSHDLYVGEIARVGVREDLFKEDGGIDFIKADLVAYNHGVYQALGAPLGFFGFAVASPDVLKRRMQTLENDAKAACRTAKRT